MALLSAIPVTGNAKEKGSKLSNVISQTTTEVLALKRGTIMIGLTKMKAISLLSYISRKKSMLSGRMIHYQCLKERKLGI